ncbi:hypothetical protein [Bradyrhizobium sp. Gha]|uniref:hypothetical protein n=1 Tax=Bradyrhizobium sp. Gha TaxID=1855318 RepID=UPI0008DEF22B|nr:hypothetical protein [Bradyrhizobium sp. Gha]SFJ53393.1 hypothetical protein SAMN05216525_12798 [Bradyrhizobium sp. Gha]
MSKREEEIAEQLWEVKLPTRASMLILTIAMMNEGPAFVGATLGVVETLSQSFGQRQRLEFVERLRDLADRLERQELAGARGRFKNALPGPSPDASGRS